MEATLTEQKEKAQSESPRRSWWHWQNLNDKKDGTQGSGFRHGRAWWHFPLGRVNWGSSRTIELCWNFFSHFCGVQLDTNDEDVTLMLAFPPIAIWFSLSTNWAWLNRILPRRALQYYPDTIVIDERECGIRIHSGRLWVNVWSKRNETVTADPWWVRGVSFNLNPFEWRHIAHEVRCADGSWVPYVGSWEVGQLRTVNDNGATMGGKEPDGREMFEFPYRYVLKNGTAQERTAAVYVERREWRALCLRWTTLFAKRRQCIDIAFSDEVGERSGSWKGGCTGCGYDLLPNETAEQCLRRMERERKF